MSPTQGEYTIQVESMIVEGKSKEQRQDTQGRVALRCSVSVGLGRLVL